MELKAKLFQTKSLAELMGERSLGKAANAPESAAAEQSAKSPTKPRSNVPAEETPEAIVAAAEVAFKPCRDQRMAKAAFYTAIKGLGIDIAHLDIDTVARYCSHAALYNWWELPGFKDWFRNAEIHKHKVRMLLDRQLELLEEIQENVDQLYSVKDVLAAGKQILEYKKAFEDDDKAGSKDMASDEETVTRIASKMLEAKRLADKQKQLAGRVELPS
jgi:hypothetical protein